MAARASARGPLSRDEIVRAAIDLAEDGGLEKMSLHKIAQAVGVKTMSLYNHVADKSDVLDGMADQIMAEIVLPDLDAMSWEDGLRSLSTAFRSAAMRYPCSAPLVLTRRINAPSVLPVVDAALRLLDRAGVGTADAVHILRTYIAFLVGTMLREIGTSPTSSVQPSIVATSASALVDAGLPAVADAADELSVCDHEYEMQFGLNLLLNSVRARTRTSK
jgi:AcrR family transcriptional regulator